MSSMPVRLIATVIALPSIIEGLVFLFLPGGASAASKPSSVWVPCSLRSCAALLVVLSMIAMSE